MFACEMNTRLLRDFNAEKTAFIGDCETSGYIKNLAENGGLLFGTLLLQKIMGDAAKIE